MTQWYFFFSVIIGIMLLCLKGCHQLDLFLSSLVYIVILHSILCYDYVKTFTLFQNQIYEQNIFEKV